jgi:hypothetical protein
VGGQTVVVKIGDHCRLAIDLFESDEKKASMLFACLAVDGTAKKAIPSEVSNRVRFETFLRQRYWLLEPMTTPGINLEATRWTNLPIGREPAPDFAAIVYRVFRCSLGHGDELPAGFDFTSAVGTNTSRLRIAHGLLHLPDRLPFALMAAAVLCPVSRGQTTAHGYFLSLGSETFVINEWWGREDDFRPIAAKYNTTRVTLDGL